MNPTVSIIIPTYNRSQFVTEAIDSVLAQTYKDYEIIVVDDGSTDNTSEILEPYQDKIRYIFQENQGLSAARNTGIKDARGRFIALLDSDDLWLPGKLAKQMAALDKNGDVAFVYSNFVFIDEVGGFLKVAYKPKTVVSGHIFEDVLLCRTAPSYPSTWLLKKECFDEVGLFDTEFKRSEERDIGVRIAKIFKMYGIAEPLVKIRQIRSVETLGRCSAKDREYYRSKFLDKLFRESNGEPIIEKNKGRLTAHYYFIAGLAYLKEQNLSAARNRFWLSIVNRPFQLKAYMYFLVTLTGNKGFGALNAIRRLFVRVSNYFRRLRHKQKCQ